MVALVAMPAPCKGVICLMKTVWLSMLQNMQAKEIAPVTRSDIRIIYSSGTETFPAYR